MEIINKYKTLFPSLPPAIYIHLCLLEKAWHWLKDCETIEDWGCGLADFKRFCKTKYVGVDSEITPFSDVKADLTIYKSSVDGIYMKDILETELGWSKIVGNALESFTYKMCLIISGSDKLNNILTSLKAYKFIYKVENIKFEDKSVYMIYIKRNYLAFYTVFIGADDNPAFRIPSAPSTKYDCYYYTNNKKIFQQLESKQINPYEANPYNHYLGFGGNLTGWIPRFLDIPISHDHIESSMASKHVRVLPFDYEDLQKYEYTCFMDSKLPGFTEREIEKAVRGMKAHSKYMLVRPHAFIKPNVYDEFNESMKQLRYSLQKERYVAYIQRQLNSGLSPTTAIHYVTGFIIRDMAKSREICETWYSHIQECGIQCQLSFFFVKQLYAEHIGIAPNL
jgi:hypothetical protein